MYNIEIAHYIIDEMILNGCIVEENKKYALDPIHEFDKAA